MAITNTVYPAAKHPAYNPVEWKFTSDRYDGLNNLQLKCVVKNGAGTVIASKYVQSDSSGVFTFDANKILQSQLAFTISTSIVIVAESSTGSYFIYTLLIEEWYEDGNDDFVIGDNLAISTVGGSPIICYNMAKQSDETFSDYLCNASGKFLQSRPSNLKVNTVDPLQFSFITDEASVAWVVNLVLFVGGNSSYGDTLVINGGRGIIVIPEGYLNANVNYIEVSLTGKSEILVIYVNPRCMADYATIMWKNHFGGFDTYTFPKRKIVNKSSSEEFITNGELNRCGIEAEEIWELEGSPETNDTLTWFRDLYNAREAYLVELNIYSKVVILSGESVLEDTNLIIPAVKIKLQAKLLN